MRSLINIVEADSASGDLVPRSPWNAPASEPAYSDWKSTLPPGPTGDPSSGAGPSTTTTTTDETNEAVEINEDDDEPAESVKETILRTFHSKLSEAPHNAELSAVRTARTLSIGLKDVISIIKEAKARIGENPRII